MLREKPKHSLDKSCSYKRPSTCRSRSYAARKPQAFAEHRRIPQSRTGPRQPAALGFACISVPLHGDADAQRRRAASCGKCLRAAQRREFLPHPFGASIAVDRRSRRHARVSFCSLPLFWTSKRRGVAHQRETLVPSKSHTKTHNPTKSRLPTSCRSAAMSDYALSANPTCKTVLMAKGSHLNL